MITMIVACSHAKCLASLSRQVMGGLNLMVTTLSLSYYGSNIEREGNIMKLLYHQTAEQVNAAHPER